LKLNEISLGPTEISKFVTLIDEKITMLNKERQKSLGSKIHRNRNNPFCMNHTDDATLELDGETYSSSDEASSRGEIVVDFTTREKMDVPSKCVASRYTPIPSILNLNKVQRSNYSNDDDDESVLNGSNRTCRKLILRYGTFVMRPFLPLLSIKKKDDTLSYPLRL